MDNSITQKQKDEYSLQWRKEYVQLLEEKLDSLKQIMTSPTNTAFQEKLKIAEYAILAKETEHAIFWKKITLHDYLERVKRHEAVKSDEFDEAKQQINTLIDEAKKACSKPVDSSKVPTRNRLLNLIERKSGVDMNDPEQATAYYKSLKLELSRMQ